MNKTIPTSLIIGILSLMGEVSFAGSATWKLDPVDNNWNNPANWTPPTVPNGPTDVATFAESNRTELVFSSTRTEVAGIVFTSDASSFTITASPAAAHTSVTLTISGAGITNNSGLTQTLTAGPPVLFDVGMLNFRNSASVGDQVALNALASDDEGSFPYSQINFYDTSSAGNASIYAEGARGDLESYGGRLNFYNSATAGNASCTVTGSFASGSYGGQIEFVDDSNAGTAIFTVLGPSNGGFFGGAVSFFDDSYAQAAEFMVFAGGGVGFSDASDGGQSQIELFDGTFSASSTDRGEVTVGSIEGEDGVIALGTLTLLIGSNNLNTTFSGAIVGGGPIEKIGRGSLTLSGANSYLYGTTVTSGILKVNNATGSGTGVGTVRVNAGTLAGSGMIDGAVIVGTNTGVQAFLAPSKGAKKPATLTIQSPLTLNDDSTYIYQLNTKRAVSDQVVANGVVIDSGAKFSFRPSGNNALTVGQIFTVISNTAATSITGTFHNLPEGKILIVNGTKLQASYTGGDGNDLTLTVVP